MIILAFLLAHWYLSLFGQTFFLHRYSAHKMFTLSPFWEKVFFFFTWFTQGASFLNPRAYAILHRMHHAYSDTEKDPHSPHFFKDVFRMMWQTKKIYHGVLNRTYQVEPKFEKNYPEWPALERFGDRWPVRIAFGTLYVLFYFYFAEYWWMYLLLPIHFLIGPIQGATVNWAGHKYGYRNHPETDHSKNTLFWDIILLGELFQNNHHKYAARANFANKWWEFDPTYPVIKVLSWVGIIKMNKQG